MSKLISIENLINWCILFLSLLIMACPIGDSAGSTETENVGTISGTIHLPDGTPAENATIYIVSVEHIPGAANVGKASIIDTVKTNENGEFQSDSLPDGFYNVIGVKEDLSLLVSNQEVSDKFLTKMGVDSLAPPGSLTGVVRLQPNDDSRTVFIQILGTPNFYSPTDSIGNFTLDNLAEGSYTARFLSTLDDYKPYDTSIVITSDVSDTLADTLFLPFTGIPIVTGMTLEYDTLKQIVTLSWEAADSALVKGYNVYRKHSDSDFVKVNSALVTDTMYADSTGIQDQSYEYKLKAVDPNDNEGEFGVGDSVNMDSPLSFSLVIGSRGNLIGQFQDPRGITGNSSIVYITDYTLEKIEKYDLNGNYIDQTQTNFKPFEIFLSNKNNLILIARKPDLIIKMDTLWNILDTFEIHNDLNEPFGLAQDSDNFFYVTNRISNKILVYNENGSYIRSWGGTGSAQGLFDDAYGITIDDSNMVYVTDGSNHRVQKFTNQGEYISTWGTKGFGIGDFQIPVDIDFDKGFLFVLEWSGRRIQKFSKNGSIVFQFKNNPRSSSSFGGSLNNLWIDPGQNIWISEGPNNFRVQKFNHN